MSEELDSKSASSEAKEKMDTDDDNTASSEDVKDTSKEVEKNAANDAKSEDDEDEKNAKKENDTAEENAEKGKAKDATKEAQDNKDVKPKKKEEKATEEEEEESDGKEDDENGEEEEDEEDEEEEDKKKDKGKKKEKGVPLLDQPLEVAGKRSRKNVDRFEEDVAVSEPTKLEFAGSGTPLGEIPRVEASIMRFKVEDLKILHKLLFKTPGKNAVIKRNVKKFNGFEFKKDSEEYKNKVASAMKYDLKHLKSICEMLDLAKTGDKEGIVNRIVEFLIEPKDSGKPVGGGRPKRTAAVKANNRGYSSHDDFSSEDEKAHARGRRNKGGRSNLKDESSESDFKPSDDDEDDPRKKVSKRKRTPRKKKDSEDEDEESDVESAPSSDEDSDAAPKSRKKKASPKANNRKSKTPAKRGRKPAPKKTPAKKKKKAETSEEESDEKDEGSSSEDEPLSKKAKTSAPPTDDEIKTYVKQILEGANLEEITMKTVCQKVYDHYPDFDLAHKKDFIKTTVKSLIST